MKQKYFGHENIPVHSRLRSERNKENKYSELSHKEQFKPKFKYHHYALQLPRKTSRDAAVDYYETVRNRAKYEQDKFKKTYKENDKESNQYLKRSTSQGQFKYQTPINHENVDKRELQKWCLELQYRVQNLLKLIENCQQEKQMLSQNLEKKLSRKNEDMNRVIGMQREKKKKFEELFYQEIEKHKETRTENDRLRLEHLKHQQEIRLFEILRNEIDSTLKNFDEVVRCNGILKGELEEMAKKRFEECLQDNKMEQILKNNHELREKMSIIFKASFEKEKQKYFKELDNLKAMNEKLQNKLEYVEKELSKKKKSEEKKEPKLNNRQLKANSIRKLSSQFDRKISQFKKKQSQYLDKMIEIKSSLVKTCLQETQLQQPQKQKKQILKTIESQTQINQALFSNHQQKNKQLESLQKQLTKSQEELDAALKENKQLKQQLIILQDQLQSFQKKEVNYAQEKDNSKNQEIELKMKIFNLELEIVQFKKQIEFYKNISKERQQMQIKIQKLQGEIMNFQQSESRHQELQLKSYEFSNNIAELEKQLAGKSQQVQDSQKVIEKMRKQNERKQKSIKVLNSQLNQLEIQIEVKNQQLNLQQKELDNFKNKIKDGNNQRQKLLLKTIQEQKESLEQVIAEKNNLMKLVKQLQEKYSRLEEQVENKYIKQISYMKKKLRNINKENDNLKNENHRYRKEMALFSKFGQEHDLQFNISEFRPEQQDQQSSSNINYQ